ncbi:MAG: ABC transporter substrate-binding protein [Rhodocyclaceae bacterium]|nr:ABC transporter substrate-binding protein [Rhodocyclaceae bacterium]MBX3678199.1 ABC transporter substrate-binding protein [Rhodocyclaceae bacterium]MCB1892318.1 ABC transporter substrate-binding protein [Rhodocyclaceae bacterium]MCW5596694.1 ABC transporter substrate-binding protein [Rhodocyclaceae bacterium]
MQIRKLALFLSSLCVAGAALADITVGVSVSATGPAASLGIPEKNTFALLPQTIAGEKVKWVVLDDATDTTTAVKNARKFVSEDKADVLIAATATPTSMAILEVAFETKTPQIAMAPLPPAGEKAGWVFTTPQNFGLMAVAIAEHMAANGVKTIGFIGYADPYGELWLKAITGAAESKGIKLTAVERYQRNDTSVTGQALKIMAANPDAVLIAGSGTPAVLPQATLVERGYKGRYYQTHGIANRDFLRVGGKNVEGTIFPVGPMLLAEQLPDSHPSKKPALDYIKLYEGAHGPNSRSTFGAHAYDAYLLLTRAVPEAMKKAKPGTPEFRMALRDALEGVKELPATHGVFSMSPTNHNGFDARAAVMATVANGDWKLLK